MLTLNTLIHPQESDVIFIIKKTLIFIHETLHALIIHQLYHIMKSNFDWLLTEYSKFICKYKCCVDPTVRYSKGYIPGCDWNFSKFFCILKAASSLFC